MQLACSAELQTINSSTGLKQAGFSYNYGPEVLFQDLRRDQRLWSRWNSWMMMKMMIKGPRFLRLLIMQVKHSGLRSQVFVENVTKKKSAVLWASLLHDSSNNRVGHFSISQCEWENKLKLNHVHEQHKAAIDFSSQVQRSRLRSYMITFIGLIEPKDTT